MHSLDSGESPGRVLISSGVIWGGMVTVTSDIEDGFLAAATNSVAVGSRELHLLVWQTATATRERRIWTRIIATISRLQS